MGCSESQQAQVYDHKGKIVMNRKCIALICPPSFEVSKFVETKPGKINYRYISVGRLIRDEINKRTHYSKIIMENLTKYKKINEKILEVLLKNIALQGNFIIQFCPKDSEDLDIWRKFLKQVSVQLIVVIKPNHKVQASQQKSIFEEKMKNYYRDIKNIEQMFKPEMVKHYDGDPSIWEDIFGELAKQPKS